MSDLNETLRSLEREFEDRGLSFDDPNGQPLWAAVGRPVGALPADWPGLPHYEVEVDEQPSRWVSTVDGLVGVTPHLASWERR